MELVTPVFLGMVVIALVIVIWAMVRHDKRQSKQLRASPVYYTPRKKLAFLPWWLDIVWVLLLSFGFLLVAVVIRLLVGLPSQTHHAGYPWVGYTVCWLAFVVLAHNGQRYNTYFPLSGGVVLVAT